MDTKQLRWRALMWAMAAIASLLLAACADTEGEKKTVVAASTWTQMTASGGTLSSCQGCHTGTAGSAPGGLSLDADQYSAVLAGGSSLCTGITKLVNVGDHTTSALYLVAADSSICTFSPSPMPGGQAVAPEIAAWIDAGAPQ